MSKRQQRMEVEQFLLNIIKKHSCFYQVGSEPKNRVFVLQIDHKVRDEEMIKGIIDFITNDK